MMATKQVAYSQLADQYSGILGTALGIGYLSIQFVSKARRKRSNLYT